MANPATVRTPMTVEEFLQWDSGDDFVWELIDGYPRLKYPPNQDLLGQAAASDEHAVIAGNLQRIVGMHILDTGRPCRVMQAAGQKVSRQRQRVRIPDFIVKCGATEYDAREPILIVEVNSPSNTADDLDERLADFRALPTVQEILILAQDRPTATLHRRVGDLWRVDRLEGLDALLNLESIGLQISLREVYRAVLRDEPVDRPA